MLIVETIAKIRRDRLVHGKSIRSISRDRRLSRNTVRKVLRSVETMPWSYHRNDQPRPKLGDYVAQLEGLLESNQKVSRRERLTFLYMFESLRDAGYGGGYDAVRRYARAWQRRQEHTAADAFVPLIFDPGEAYQFDWSHEIVVLGGITQTVKVAHTRLCHSRMRLIVAYPRETQEMVFDAHDQAFEFFGGSCTRGIYDNMKTAVDAVYVGKARKFNRRFEEMCLHYLVEPIACSPGAGWEKGQVENQVQNSRERFFAPRPQFESLEALNIYLRKRCLDEANRLRHPDLPQQTVFEVFQRERQTLIPYVSPFDGYRAEMAAASKTCLVRFDRNRYSVASSAAGKPVELQAYADRVVIRHQGKIVATHARCFGRDQVIYDPWHYVPVLKRKPGALRNGAPFRDWDLPHSLRRVRAHFGDLDDGDRQMVKILNAVLTDSLEEVSSACEAALQAGTVSADIILNLLSRSQAPEPVASIDTPASLHVEQAPLANCERYDGLREGSSHATP
ncbi:MAG: IS21 family transposase [Proteobacteria bacterium]|nr:IS21 family transposase [Pseudomonadota bacterium]